MECTNLSSVAEQLESLIDWFRPFRSCLVAFSAGVDSSLLAYAAFKALNKKAYAVTSHSPAFSMGERNAARKVAKEIGIRLYEVIQDDLADPEYVKNEVMRCYFCRTNLATVIQPLRQELSIDVLVDGTHVEDMLTPRPGIKALREAGSRAPLNELGFGKQQIREMARLAGLSNWDRPSEACLSSRVAFGQKIDRVTLSRIETAENEVKMITGAKIVRVRTIGRTARVEVDKEHVKVAILNNNLITKKLEELGYETVEIDEEGYVTGKMLQLFIKNGE